VLYPAPATENEAITIHPYPNALPTEVPMAPLPAPCSRTAVADGSRDGFVQSLAARRMR